MSVQTSYNFATPKGVAGGLYDLSPYAVDSRRNEADDGVLKFGMGVVVGTTAGNQVKVPAATSDKFEGVALNGFSSELDMDGKLTLKKGATVGVLRKGRVWARIKAGVTVAYGNDVYLIANGANAGLFTNAEEKNGESTVISIKITGAKFVGVKGTGDVAPVELN